QKIVNNRGANLVPFLCQLFHQITQAARGPQRRLHRVAARCGLDQAFEIEQASWILGRLLLPPTAPLADTAPRSRQSPTLGLLRRQCVESSVRSEQTPSHDIACVPLALAQLES